MIRAHRNTILTALIALSFTQCIPAADTETPRAFQCEPAADLFSGGEGTLRAPYVLCSEDDLQLLAASPEHWRANFGLGANIAMTRPIDPIGTEDEPFAGILDGDGLSIIDLEVAPADDLTALFGVLSGELTNLGLRAPRVQGSTNVAALVAFIQPGGKVSDVFIDAAIIEADNYAGILAAWNFGIVERSHVNGRITAQSGPPQDLGFQPEEETEAENLDPAVAVAGGLVGASVTISSTAAQIRDSSAEIVINSKGQVVGGLVGFNGASILRSSSRGEIRTTDSASGFYGGLAGSNTQQGSISESFSAVDLDTAAQFVGGLLGANEGQVENTYAIGQVEASNFGAGLIGVQQQGASLTNSFAFGRVTSATTEAAPNRVFSGLVTSLGSASVVNSFFNETKNPQLSSGPLISGTSLPEESFRDPQQFGAWDLQTIWFHNGGTQPHPRLRMESTR